MKRIKENIYQRRRPKGRELDVIVLLHSQFTQKEIAVKLKISVNTVKSHVRSAAAKIGVRGGIGLALFWERCLTQKG